MVTSGGHGMIGGMSSTTVMVWTQVAVLLQMSVAVHVRVMIVSQLSPVVSSV
ncbi:MAG: hypothetical protein ACYSUA_17405 [Planctomycetota bacterium]